MPDINNLREKEFPGTVLKEIDPTHRGRYKVHIPELMPHIDKTQGIWCRNHTHSWRITNSVPGYAGQYFPLQENMKVIVKFFSNDFNTGYIDRIISDYAENTMPTYIKAHERDLFTSLFCTPKYENQFYIREDTDAFPNTVWLVYNQCQGSNRRTVMRISEEGIHIYTRDNDYVRIKKNNFIEVNGIYHLTVTQNCNFYCYANTNIWASANVNIDSGIFINLNCGMPHSPMPVKDLETDDVHDPFIKPTPID